MSIFRRLMVKFSGNSLIQRLLEKNVEASQFLMGVGAGARVQWSGEHASIQMLRRVSKPPYVVFDIGSNSGQFLEVFFNNVGSDDFRVHCFEPGRVAYKGLTEYAPADDRIVLNPFGLGKNAEQRTLYYNKEGSGGASLTKRRLDHFDIEFEQSETVRIETVDAYCETHAIESIDLLARYRGA